MRYFWALAVLSFDVALCASIGVDTRRVTKGHESSIKLYPPSSHAEHFAFNKSEANRQMVSRTNVLPPSEGQLTKRESSALEKRATRNQEIQLATLLENLLLYTPSILNKFNGRIDEVSILTFRAFTSISDDSQALLQMLQKTVVSTEDIKWKVKRRLELQMDMTDCVFGKSEAIYFKWAQSQPEILAYFTAKSRGFASPPPTDLNKRIQKRESTGRESIRLIDNASTIPTSGNTLKKTPLSRREENLEQATNYQNSQASIPAEELSAEALKNMALYADAVLASLPSHQGRHVSLIMQEVIQSFQYLANQGRALSSTRAGNSQILPNELSGVILTLDWVINGFGRPQGQFFYEVGRNAAVTAFVAGIRNVSAED
ncbi:MAG: hypothetical protein M1829_001691 [Trizodia sp. TS-e1964]|nr:MAG: hypothetical protein M1829_001691 [Trizodia sp. TS-e1964]